jgi:HlyD family secretion protein
MQARRRWWLPSAVLLIVLLWFVMFRGGSRIEYDTAAVDRGDIEVAVTSSGPISPLVTVPVGSQVSGQIARIEVDYNSHVHRGQLLAVVDPALFASRVRSAEADLAVQHAAVAGNEVQVSNAQVVLDQAQRDGDRAQSLAQQGLISTNDLEKARNALEQSRNQLKIARAALLNSQAQLAKVQTQLDQARIDLSHTEIRSPVDGVVITRSVDVGQTVQSAMQVATLFQIARDLSQVQIETKVDEADIGEVMKASRASFTVDAYPGRSFAGRIAQVRINGTTTANVVTYSVMVQADNPGEQLLPGMTANVRLITGERRGVLRIPARALRFRPGKERPRGEGFGGPGAAPPAGGSTGAGPARPAAGGGGAAQRPLPEMTPALMQQLGLDARAQAAVVRALADAAARSRASGQSPGANPLGSAMPNFRRMFGNPADEASANRQRQVNALATVLSPGQLQQYLALAAAGSERATTVYVPDASGAPRPRPVRVGLADDNYVELRSGLAAGERVVVGARPAARG